MITPLMLHSGLCDFLEKEVASTFKLRTVDCAYNESFAIPMVIRCGFAIPKSIDKGVNGYENYEKAECQFPYILPRIEKIEHLGNAWEAIAHIKILFGVYGPATYGRDGKVVNDGGGYTDLWNMIETTRQKLFSTGTIAERFSIIEDFFESGMLTEQIYPYWKGACKVKYHVAYPKPNLDFTTPNNLAY